MERVTFIGKTEIAASLLEEETPSITPTKQITLVYKHDKKQDTFQVSEESWYNMGFKNYMEIEGEIFRRLDYKAALFIAERVVMSYIPRPAGS